MNTKIIIEKKVEEFMDATKFYKMKMNNDKIFAFTIYDGCIFLKEKYIKIAIDNKIFLFEYSQMIIIKIITFFQLKGQTKIKNQK